MTTSTRNSREINMEPDQHNRCEKSNGESSGTSYSTGKRENNEDDRGRLLIEEAKQELNLFEKQMMKRSIFRFPRWAKSITPRYFEIGPFHHSHQQNSQVAFVKNTAVLNFLSRINKSLEHVMREMREVVEELQAHYAFLEDKWRNDMKFVEIMIFDGCFIFGLLQEHDARSIGYDPHYGTYEASHRLIPQFRDMVLLDNQLPLLAVKVLFQIVARSMNKRPPTDEDINNLVFKFLGMDDMVNKTQTLGLHIHDLYRKGIIGPLTTNNVSASSSPESDSDVVRPSPPRFTTTISIRMGKNTLCSEVALVRSDI
ncbi:Tubulin/FtsZ GTPase domain-containing protein [Dioscorea alata]|uniref:Tubulin/FtsZ GTPase domain-containing protein n=1 Tax=Dioscorea alata TaxID=55571 RepID=A0ACB7TZD0_DIOAL|nr:Tubulin/FtsZ GTPase domain-containing protein [Dioscorea alata]